MTTDNGARLRGDAFRDEEMDLTKALGAKRQVLVRTTFMGGALRDWARGDDKRAELLHAMYLAHVRSDRERQSLLDRDGLRELAIDLTEFLLARLPQFEFAEEVAVDAAECRGRMWKALKELAEACPRLFLLDESTDDELQIGVELEDESRPWTAIVDRPQYDEAEFWAATSCARPKRAPRLSFEDHECGRMASERDLAPLLNGTAHRDDTCIPGVTPIVEVSQDGGELGFLPARSFHIPREMRRRHMLVVGPTGTGKTTRLVLPLLRSDIANRGLTVVVIDTKGELLPAVRSFVEAYRPGEEVHLVNFRDPQRSLGWNPLARVETRADAFELAHNLCHAVENGRASQDSVFWLNNSIDLLSAMFVALKRQSGAAASIADALHLADLSVQEFDKFAQRFPDLDVLSRFAAYVKSGSHNAETILADLRMRLVLWRDERVCAVTSADELDFALLAKRPSVIVLQVPEEDVVELKPVTNAWLDQLLATELAVAREAPGMVLPVQLSLYLEEFASSVGRIPKFERRLNTCRQPGISVTASVQSLWQIEHEYGSAFRSILAGFSTKILFADCLVEDANWFSSSAGETTVLDSTITTHEAVGSEPLFGLMAPTRRTRTEHASERPLLSSSQLLRPLSNEILGRALTWFAPGLPPFQAFIAPLYQLVEGARLMERGTELGGPGELREEPLVYLPARNSARDPSADSPSTGLSNTLGWTDERIRLRLDEVLRELELQSTTGSALKWWRAFEQENAHRLALVLRLAEELEHREATLTEFFLAYVYSNTDNIQANLHYLDYSRLKRKDESKQRKTRAAAACNRQREETSRSSTVPGGRLESEAKDKRQERLRMWLCRRRERGLTYADTAKQSGFTIDCLRYWNAKLDL